MKGAMSSDAVDSYVEATVEEFETEVIDAIKKYIYNADPDVVNGVSNGFVLDREAMKKGRSLRVEIEYVNVLNVWKSALAEECQCVPGQCLWHTIERVGRPLRLKVEDRCNVQRNIIIGGIPLATVPLCDIEEITWRGPCHLSLGS